MSVRRSPLVPLRRIEPGVYRTLDNAWQIAPGWSLTFCDNPHPMRNGYCSGNEEHSMLVWIIDRPSTVDDSDYVEVNWTDPLPTKRAAVARLAEHLTDLAVEKDI